MLRDGERSTLEAYECGLRQFSAYLAQLKFNGAIKFSPEKRKAPRMRVAMPVDYLMTGRMLT